MSKSSISQQLASHNLEITILGDFDSSDELEQLLLLYLGTVPSAPSPFDSIKIRDPVFSATAKTVNCTIEDEEERAIVLIAMKGPSRWTQPSKNMKLPNNERTKCKLYVNRCFFVLAKIISNKLFNIVREKQGLTYDINADATPFDYFDSGTFMVCVTPFVDKIEKTKEETLKVLEDVKQKKITQEELEEVTIPLAKTVATALNSNGYWLGLSFNLQSTYLPKDLDSITQIPEFYQALNLEDIFFVIDNYLQLEPQVTSIGITTK